MTHTEHKVFVYGTLKPGGHYWPQYCEGKVSEVIPARIQGELYDLKVGYPGVILRGQDWIQGYLLSFNRTADFRQLDVLEGYVPSAEPGQNEYNRLRVPCYSTNGESLGSVWTYEMSESAIQALGGTRIVAGNWPV